MEKRLEKINELDIEKIRELIKFSKEVIKNETDELIRIESFKITLNKLLSEYDINLKNEVRVKESTTRKETTHSNKQLELAELCSITINELNDVFKFKEDSVDIIVPINGSEAVKRMIASQCFIAAIEVVFSKEWVEAIELAECMRAIGVKDVTNLSTQLKNASEIFRTSGTRKGSKYKLTSGTGRKSAFNMIHKLARGETIEN